MDPVPVVLVVAMLVPAWLLRLDSLFRARAEAIDQEGVYLQDEHALEGRGDVIGRMGDAAIYNRVCFAGLCYEFDRLAEAPDRTRIGNRELLIEPGLVYVARRPEPRPEPSRLGRLSGLW